VPPSLNSPTNAAPASVALVQGVLSPVAELPVARCSLARYSHGGGLLAAVGRNNAITLFPSFYGDGPACSSPAASSSNKAASSRHGAAQHASGARSHLRSTGVLAPAAVLKGHVSSVTDMVFTRDDQRLITSGAGGALFTWDVATGSRLVQLDHVDKKLVFLQRPLFSRPHTTAPILCHSPSLLR
jgi:WD40 repeat protein